MKFLRFLAVTVLTLVVSTSTVFAAELEDYIPNENVAFDPETESVIVFITEYPDDFTEKLSVKYKIGTEVVDSLTITQATGYRSEDIVEAGVEYNFLIMAQNDAVGQYPTDWAPGTVTTEAGKIHYVYITVGDTSIFEQITGTSSDELEYGDTSTGTVYEGTGRLSAYLTCPINYDIATTLEFRNVETGARHTITLYSSDYLTGAIDVPCGEYQFVAAYVDDKIYSYSVEEEFITIQEGDSLGVFHITITANDDPDGELETPSRDRSELNNIVDEMNNPTVEEEAVEVEEEEEIVVEEEIIEEVSTNNSWIRILMLAGLLVIFGVAYRYLQKRE